MNSIALPVMKIRSQEEFSGNITSFGGKADGLIFLTRNGFRVPQFWIITYEQIKSIGTDQELLALMLKEWTSTNSITDSALWSVRSSAGVEDGKEKSFAGLFRTVLNVRTASLSEAVLHVMEGFDEISKSGYHSQSAEGNIIIQEMLDPEFSGVGFSVDPNDGSSCMQLVNVIPGLGSKLVSGEGDAFIVRIKDGVFTYEGEGNYSGQVFRNGDELVEWSADEFKRVLQPHLRGIESGLKKLKQLKGFEVDTEFAVADGKLFWLQVRPVTAVIRKQQPDAIWDNSNIGVNYPGLTLPLTISFTAWSFSRVYSVMCRFLNGSEKFIEKNQSLLDNMGGGINGGMYYNVTAWQKLLWQLPFGKKTSRLITKMWGAADAQFIPPANRPGFISHARFLFNIIQSFVFFKKHRREYYATFDKVSREFESIDLSKLNRQELIEVYRKLDEGLAGKWFAPMLNGFFTMITFARIRRSVKRSPLSDVHPNFVNDILFNTGDVISVALVREMQALLREMNSNEELKTLFSGNDDAGVWEELKTNHPSFFAKVKSYIDKYGYRVEEGELKFETVNFREDNLLFISFLRKNLAAGIFGKGGEHTFDHRKIIREYHRYNFLKRWRLNRLVKLTVNRVRDRENMRFIRTRSFAMVRMILRRIDECLVNEGLIEKKNDSLYLTYEEFFSKETEAQFRAIIAKRKEEYSGYSAEALQPRYHQFGNEFVPVEDEVTDQSGMKGAGCCSGSVTAEIVVIDAANIYEVEPDGKILLSKYFEPGWIGLFSRAAGLISERGSLLSHTAILCREIGMPSIVGAKGVMRNLKTGDRVRMNGATGKIELINEE